MCRDVRKDEPYMAYKDFDFQVICSDGGDCFHRYLVRMEETLESLKIIEVLENLPEGPVNVDTGERLVLPDKDKVYNTIEGCITHFEVIMTNRGMRAPMQEIYSPFEAPNGERGFYLVGMGATRRTAHVVARRVTSTLPCSRISSGVTPSATWWRCWEV